MAIDVRRVLSRLVAKTAAWDVTPRDTSPGRMLPSDIQASLGLVRSRFGQGLVLAKWCHDFTMLPEVQAELIVRFQRAVRGKKPHVRDKQTIDSVCWLAIEELIDPNLCKVCGGAGERFSIKRKLRLVCEACAGSGRKAPSNRARARYCGLNEKTWRLGWASRYEVAFRIVGDAHGKALNIIRKSLQ
jgi:hypothetical protein